jgi:hypothetical protein
MSDQGEEGQVPAPPGAEGKGELPPRPTVRESLRRGLFVRLPTEGESREGVPGAEQPAKALGDLGQYPEQYPGWRQAADGSWEQVEEVTYGYQEGYEPAAPDAYPEIDQGVNFASIAGGEPFVHGEEPAGRAWTFTQPSEVAPVEVPGDYQQPVAAEEPSATTEAAPPEAVAEAAPVAEVAPLVEEILPSQEPPAEVVVEEQAPVAEAAPVEASTEVEAPAPAPVPEAAAVPEAPIEAAPVEPAPSASSSVVLEDPVAAAGVYIPAGVELLEDDMLVFGEKENVPPRFTGEGLGEPVFVEFGELSQTLTGLRRLLPKGTRLTYNYDFARAWVRTSAEVDLPAYVERVQALD